MRHHGSVTARQRDRHWRGQELRTPPGRGRLGTAPTTATVLQLRVSTAGAQMGAGEDRSSPTERRESEDVDAGAGAREPAEDAASAPAEVRVDYAPVIEEGHVILVPPDPADPFVDGEPTARIRPAHTAQPAAARRAADALPPRNRRPVRDDDAVTPPRARDLRASQRAAVDESRRAEAANERPPSEEPTFGAPLYVQDWGSTPSGAPTWKPGQPPVDAEPPSSPWLFVGIMAILGTILLVFWLAQWN
jgi:hypothetical protein